MTKERKIVRVIIKGRVQGVGYRAWTQMEAFSRGISGWVRNRLNGDVEAVFAGRPDAVEALCAACWRGPSQSRVTKVHVEDASEAELALWGVTSGFHQISTR
jgi:acylphosphatase